MHPTRRPRAGCTFWGAADNPHRPTPGGRPPVGWGCASGFTGEEVRLDRDLLDEAWKDLYVER